MARPLARLGLLGLTFLLIEFADELAFGAREAAWPAIRGDLHLSYVEIGLILSLPGLVSVPLEPLIGILGDIWKRRVLILGGGAVFGLSLFLFAVSPGFGLALLASITVFPASTAFVSLSQATLMDLEPSRHEQNMARWMFAGSVGALAGPLLLAAGSLLSLSWRVAFVAIALFSAALLALAWRQVPASASNHHEEPTLWGGMRGTLLALRRWDVIRWLLLLECADLMMDVLLGFLALYFTDRVGVSAAGASLSVAVWTGAELLGSLALIPLLERVQGSRYLRLSAFLELGLFPAFLLAPGFVPKLALLALVGFVNAGWYPVLQGRLYSSMPGQSGTVVSLGAVTGLIHLLPPLVLAAVAQRYNLGVALWLILLSPLALLVGLPPGEAIPVPSGGEEVAP